MSENFFWGALLISLTIHTSFLWGTYLFKVNDPHYKALHSPAQVEISYKPLHRRSVDIHEYPVKPAGQLDLSNNAKLFPSEGTIPINLVKERQALPFGMRYERKPQSQSPMQLSRRVTIAPIESEKINNPAYAAYSEMVRSRIKEKVYQNYDKMQRGSVYLTFMLDNHGALQAAKIILSKTDASDHLQEISLHSLQEASPFPHFLRGMTLPEYTFNIEIQYQVSDQ
jgi:hypothetical protein